MSLYRRSERKNQNIGVSRRIGLSREEPQKSVVYKWEAEKEEIVAEETQLHEEVIEASKKWTIASILKTIGQYRPDFSLFAMGKRGQEVWAERWRGLQSLHLGLPAKCATTMGDKKSNSGSKKLLREAKASRETNR